MLKALLVGNPASAAGHHLADVNVPGRWITEPGTVTADDVSAAELLVLLGGDGTMQITLSQILDQIAGDRLPPVVLMPFGTTNMNANDLNRVTTRKAAVHRLKTVVSTGSYSQVSRPLVRIVDAGQRRHGFFFGVGVIAQVVKQWNDERKPGPFLNQIRSLKAMIKGLSSASSACEIRLNGVPHSVYGLLVTTLDKLLFRSRPYWGNDDDGELRVTWVEAGAPHLLRHALPILRGNPALADSEGYESCNLSQARLAFDGPYMIDGEIFEPAGADLLVEASEPIRWVRL